MQIFATKDDLVEPKSLAAGPFGNIHGGAAAAVMASAAIQKAPFNFIPVAQHSEFLRSTPLASISLTVEPVREGRTVRVYDVAIVPDGTEKISARSTLTFYCPSMVEEIEPRAPNNWGGHKDPETLPVMPSPVSPSGASEWMLTATDVRSDFSGVWWFRWKDAFMAGEWDHWFTRIQGPSDWVGGFIRPDFPRPSKVNVWPNTDLSVHVDRPLQGEWIGLQPSGSYRRRGHGFGYGRLIDCQGIFGHVTASVLAPVKP